MTDHAPATKEVVMAENAPAKPNDTPTPPQEASALLLADIKKNISLLEKSVASKETRLMTKAMRNLPSIRRKVTVQVLRDVVQHYFALEEDQPQKHRLLEYLSHIETQEGTTPMETEAPKQEKKPKVLVPEVEIYLHLLITIFLLDKKQHETACKSSSALVERLHFFNRRTLNILSAKVYFYYSRSFELMHRLENIRTDLLAFYRTASLRHNDEAQAVLVNAILRNYLEYNLYDQAEKFVSNITFKEESTSSNQYARFLYYQGKIKSAQLEYTEAYKCLLAATRKAPQASAKGFRIAVHKLACIVQLLMGEIPERSIFRQPGLKKALAPYLQLTQTVRIGDLVAFHNVVNTFASLFRSDRTFTLIQRLHHNVIKTGLRKIYQAYTRISFDHISAKLHLDSADDVEFIVAKAVRDGVINATINHQDRYIQSKENLDVYSTQEPQGAFHKRIKFCLRTHNEAVKAMRYPPDAHKPSPQTEQERRQREQEIAKMVEEEEEDGF